MDNYLREIWEEVIIAHQQGDLQKTLQLLLLAAQEDPTDYLPALWLARLSDDPLEELFFIRQAELLNPKDKQIRRVRIKLEEQLELNASSISLVEKKVAPEIPGLLTLMGEIEEDTDDLEVVDEFSTVSIEKKPSIKEVAAQLVESLFNVEEQPLDSLDEFEEQGEELVFPGLPKISIARPDFRDSLIKEIAWLGIGWIGLFILILVMPQFPLFTPLRLVLGLAFVLVVPGYCLSVVLFPRKDDIEYVVRITLVFGLSLAVLPALAFLLNILPWGINLWSVFIGLSLICFLSAFVALFRRGNIPPQERFQLVQRIELRNWWAELDHRERKIYQFISLVLVLAIIVAGSVFVLPNRAERLTEFYLLGTSGLADSYPWGGEQGESFAVNIGIVNHESKPVKYRVEVKDGNEVIGSIAATELKSGEKLEKNLVFRPITTGNNIPIYFLLYRGGDQSPYRTLRLWLDVGVSSD